MSRRFEVRSINISDVKGVSKRPISSAKFIEGYGIDGDSHAGPWNRQVTILSEENIIDADSGRGIVSAGSFAENLTISGMDTSSVKLLDRFQIGDVGLEVTQIGKVCHEKCAIGESVGDCIMPRLGLFTRVLTGGMVKPGDEGEYSPKTFKAMVITLSDRASSGIYKDESGPAAADAIERFFGEWGYEYDIHRHLIPDDPDALAALFHEARDGCFDLLLTSGGTGLGPKDFTPEVTRDHLDIEIPGVMEHIRTKFGAQFPNALVSRGVAGVMGLALVYNLPGSPRGVGEYLGEILPTLKHSIYMIHGLDIH